MESDPDVVDDGRSFALGSLWVSYQVIPGTENPPAEREVFIRGAGEAQTRVLGHSVGGSVQSANQQLQHHTNIVGLALRANPCDY